MNMNDKASDLLSRAEQFAKQVSHEMGLGGEINENVRAEAARRLKAAFATAADVLSGDVPRCPGCMRPELHKMCPAWGTPKYMTGELFTEEDEKKYAKEREEAIQRSRRREVDRDSIGAVHDSAFYEEISERLDLD